MSPRRKPCRVRILWCFFAGVVVSPVALGESKAAEVRAAGNSPSASASATATIIQPPRPSCDRALNSLSINTYTIGTIGREDNQPPRPLIMRCYMKSGRLQMDLIVDDNREATGVTDIPLPAMAEPPNGSHITNHRPANGPPYQQRVIEFIYNYE